MVYSSTELNVTVIIIYVRTETLASLDLDVVAAGCNIISTFLHASLLLLSKIKILTSTPCELSYSTPKYNTDTS